MNGKARHFLVVVVAAAAFATSARLARSEEEWLKAFNEGTRHYQMRDFPQALLAWERSQKLNPAQPGTYANIAKVESILGRYQEAIVAFDKCLERRPPAKWAASIWYDKATCYRELKLNHKCVEARRKSLEIEPDNARYWTRLGDALSRIGHTEEAVRAYEKSLELKPGAPDTLDALEDEKERLEKGRARSRRPWRRCGSPACTRTSSTSRPRRRPSPSATRTLPRSRPSSRRSRRGGSTSTPSVPR